MMGKKPMMKKLMGKKWEGEERRREDGKVELIAQERALGNNVKRGNTSAGQDRDQVGQVMVRILTRVGPSRDTMTTWQCERYCKIFGG
ncbi:hypothetical protein TWF694_002694 [Orbilia ellipsospora]|uniref:Uncharacterized protein n=1 Tax=Orbilia ellipsospora TaxID=2528407 RepID=A0AAV9X3Y6_9PEZI